MYNYFIAGSLMDFNEKELTVIDNVIDELSDMNANQISEYSHGEMQWRAT